MAEAIEAGALSLEEFIALPTTVTFDAMNTKRLQEFVTRNPYIMLGTQLGTGYVPVHADIAQIPILINELGRQYLLNPAILSPLEEYSNVQVGITPIVQHPYLNLTGKGVIIGFVDTGIDYTRDVFREDDGSSKIISIWDQTIEGARPPELYFGAEYTREQINEALQSDHPRDIVPSMDTDGHGTFLASLAAGCNTEEYSGAAPDAQLVVVKLKRAHQYFINEFLLPPDNPNYYQNSDMMLGMQYIVNVAKKLDAPMVICLGMGSNETGHDGYTMFEEYISYLTQRPGFAVVNAGGNESNARHHTKGRLLRTGSTEMVGIHVGDRQASFRVSIFASSFDKISLGITSPSGEIINRIPFNLETDTTETLTLERTTITISYYRAVNTVITVAFQNAKEGLWEMILYGDAILGGEYHAWLPITGQVSPNVYFIKPVPDVTIVYPATALKTITCGAYDAQSGSLYVSSSWGPTRLPRIAPDFVAPGVEVRGMFPTGLGTMTGTSTAAAITTGAVALMMQWGIIQGNYLSMDGETARVLLISGCKRDADQTYPNNKWGYGRLDLYQTFSSLRESMFHPAPAQSKGKP